MRQHIKCLNGSNFIGDLSMKIVSLLCAYSAIILLIFTTDASAKVTPEETARLGKDLTPIGAEKAGNADKTIPAWTGGLDKSPAGFKPGQPYIDPFSDDQIMFTIDQSNMDQHLDHLSLGQQALLKAYSSFTMPIYKSHRPVGYSDELIKLVNKNAVSAELVQDGNGIKNSGANYPFPIAQNGLEAIWNHVRRYRGGSLNRTYVHATPTKSGQYTLITFYEEFSERSALKDFAKNKDDNVMLYFKQAVKSPARLAGNVLLVHDTIDQVKEPRRAWIYNAGQRRVRRAPQVSYDSPGTASDALITSDNFDMYNGAPDRYDWKLEGKKELYVPYNSYKLDDKSLKYDDIIKPRHINTQYSRYELHRVYKVVATLKQGKRHIYQKRVHYIDEDTWAILASDFYDGHGNIWRVAEAHNKYFYDIGTALPTVLAYYDLLSGRYLVSGLANEIKTKFDFNQKFMTKDFSPSALRRAGRR